MKGNSKNFNLILLLILVVGLVLRFWRFWDIPFTYDELSALSRLQFDSLFEIIQFGVLPDGHPAGVHVFLYYWIGLFGNDEFIVKLPFLLVGLASVYLSYRIGSIWFSNTTGILTAVYMSSLQMTVMYSQIARPYISGLFFTLLMVLYWSKYFFEGNKRKHLLLFVVFASLSTYNHHFSLLFAAIVGVSGLWLVSRKNFLIYLLSGIAIFIFYIPHLSIFFSQLDEGGIGSWLNKPGPYFLLEFLNWLFHFSSFVWIGFIWLVVFTAFSKGDSLRVVDAPKKRVLLLMWFSLPIVIGYTYSVFFNPVLQYSMLIFSTPYLFILLFSKSKSRSTQWIIALVMIVLVVNIGSLIWTRQYYQVFYKQAFEQTVKKAVTVETNQFKDDVFIIDDYIPFYNDYYLDKYNDKIPYYTVRNKSLKMADFKRVVDSIERSVVVTSGLKPDYFNLLKEQYPYLIGYDFGFTYEQYTFSKKRPKDKTERLEKKIASTEFDIVSSNWKMNKKHIETDSITGLKVFHLKPGVEYGPGILLPLEEISTTRHLFIDIHAEVQSIDSVSKSAIVVVIKKEELTLFWKSMNFSEFEIKKGEWADVYLTVDLLTAIGQKEDLDDCTFETFVWNPNNNNLFINQFKITSRPGNPYRYSLFYDIEE